MVCAQMDVLLGPDDLSASEREENEEWEDVGTQGGPWMEDDVDSAESAMLPPTPCGGARHPLNVEHNSSGRS
jgi:hypothetical protein